MNEIEEKNTIGSLMGLLEIWSASKVAIEPGKWIEVAMKIQVLLGDEHDRLFELQSNVAKLKAMMIEEGKTAAYAKIKAEASEEYKEYCKQRAFIERITEIIRLAKVRAKLGDEEYRT